MSAPIRVLRYVKPVSILIGEKEIGMERKTKSEYIWRWQNKNPDGYRIRFNSRVIAEKVYFFLLQSQLTIIPDPSSYKDNLPPQTQPVSNPIAYDELV